MKTFKYLFISLAGSLMTFFIILSTSTVSQTSALSEATLDYYDLNGIYYYDPTGQDCMPNVNSAAIGVGGSNGGAYISGSDAASTVWSGLKNLGFTDVQTAGIMGNMSAESGFNPFSVNGAKKYGEMSWNALINLQGSPATGLYQAKNKRRTEILNAVPDKLRKYFQNPSLFGAYGENGYKPITEEIGVSSYNELVASQLSTLKREIDSAERYRKFLNESTPEAAANTFCTWNETPANSIPAAEQKCKASDRSSRAKQYYDQYAGTNGSSSSDGTSSSSPNPGSNLSSLTTPSEATTTGSNVLIIGDSITKGANDLNLFTDLMPNVTVKAENGKSFSWGLQYLKNNPAQDIIVYALGTNNLDKEEGIGTLTEDQALQAIEAAGGRKIIFVTNSSDGTYDYTTNNMVLNSLAKKYNNVFVADWANVPAHFKDDGYHVHPTNEDMKLFAQTIYDVITGSNLQISGNNVNNSACFVSSPYISGTSWNGEIGEGGFPEYNQYDTAWKNYPFGTSTIGGAGCGPTSFAMMATVLLGREVLPTETTDLANKHNIYVTGAGSSWDVTRVLADELGLQYKRLNTSGGRCTQNDINTINQALQEGWMIHTTGKGSKPFSGSGHYIGIGGINDNGEWYVLDSAHGNKYYKPAEVTSAGMNCGNVRGIKL